MQQQRTEIYARRLSELIQIPTVSVPQQQDKTVFYRFRDLLSQRYPQLFACCRLEDFNGSMLLCWKGRTDKLPILLMNHQDVVEAGGEWKYPPFSGAIAEGKIWGRGTLDTKAGLWAMLQAAEELAEQGFQPNRDIWFLSTCTEETGGCDADTISAELKARGVRFALVLDEGGMIVQEPMAGAKGSFAMVGLGEKGSANLKFIARSHGGHASTPGADTPLVRLGKFMAEAEKSKMFRVEISPTLARMYQVLGSTIDSPLKWVLGHPKLFEPVLKKVIPKVSATAGAMLSTTLAFTMAQGSEGANVLPQEAWVVGNMRYSHHQGRDASIEAVKKLAQRFDLETVVMDSGFPSPLTDYQSRGYRFVEQAIGRIYPHVITCPYIMTAASDCRFMSRVSDCCLRFAPFRISAEQLASVHGLNENLDLDTLAPAVDFYKHIISCVDFS